ncbi:MAG: type IX secretion system sortase PorU [Chitinophagaceae bacterium]|nr:type IX secretion system sortase PorU [Chitinophagaceae bacterium]
MKAVRYILIILSLNLPFVVSAQQDAPIQSYRAEKLSVGKSGIESHTLYKVERRNLQYYNTPVVTLNNTRTINLGQVKVEQGMKLPSTFEPHVSISMERKQAVAFILVPRFIRNADGTVEQLLTYDLQVNETPVSNKTTGARVYAANSVLANGSWYRIAIQKQGLYKIDYNFIKNTLGIDPGSIQPVNIRLFGNGGEMLGENNAIARADDLVENAIQVVDGGDGQFNESDYILFYANGPHSIVKDSANKRFTHNFNIYSESSYYFLSFNTGPGKRITTENSEATSNINVNSYNDFYFYEKDSVNPGKFGKAWYGDEFNDQPGRYMTRTYTVDMANLDANTPVSVRTRLGSYANSGVCYMNVKVNGQPLQNIGLQPVGASYSDPVLRMSDLTTSSSVQSSPLSLTFTFTKESSAAYGLLDFFEVNARRNLVYTNYLKFADWNSVGAGNTAAFQISNAGSDLKVWDITNPLQPVLINGSLNAGVYTFNRDASSLHTYVAFGNNTPFLAPTFIDKPANQNLHNSTAKDYIIITHPSFKSEAEQLAAYHTAKRGYRTLIVTPQEIYNEFSSGSQDVTAIRDFLKMYYDKATMSDLPDYVLFLGDASYDYKNRLSNNTNLVPVYETNESINKTTGYCTDDYYGFLDDQEDINNYSNSQINTLDIGIGRFTASTPAKISGIINKIMKYDSPASFGPWKNNMIFNADDGDGATHFEDAEIMAQYINDTLPVYNNYKIYVDGFVQQSTPAGPRTPDANAALTSQMYNGTFLMNYNGHGGPLGWCEERIFSMDDINGLTNLNKLPLFITATCDFAPFDNPAFESAGEILLTKPTGGAIALMTTTQLVYADQNRIMNLNYMKEGFKPMQNGAYPTLGDAYRLSKNLRYVSSIDEFAASNFRKFALLGDPGLSLAFPKHKVFTDSINGTSVTVSYDTLKSLGKYTISGHVADMNGNLLNDYNGIVYPVIFDKPKKLTTLGNDADSPLRDYFVQNNAVYKGKATVKNGRFSFTFVVPKDINYAIDKGKISYYAENGLEDANGFDNKVYIGGSSPNPSTDNAGPVIKGYMNDEKFVNGGITPDNGTLLVKLFDDNGINYTGNSIGHDITAVLDDNTQKTYVLNNFFEADLDDYRSGIVRFPVNNLSEGQHTFTIKAWDIFNNSSEIKINFVVVGSTEGQITHVYNYPNPFTTKTNFMFEHNMPNQNLYVNIHVLSITGKVVKTIQTMVNTPGTRVNNIEWDGLDQFGEKLGKGVYLYKLSVRSQSGFSDTQLQKLVLLQ